MKYVKVIDGTKSNASGFEYKIDDVNVSNIWNPSSEDPKEMGGFNFSTEDKILRWVHRGNTLYDVIIPQDAEVVVVDKEKGIYRSNKIIVTNPKVLDINTIKDLYKKTTLSDENFAKCLYVLLWKNMIEVSELIIKEKVKKDNVNLYLETFGNYGCDGAFSYDKLSDDAKKLYDMMMSIKNS